MITTSIYEYGEKRNTNYSPMTRAFRESIVPSIRMRNAPKGCENELYWTIIGVSFFPVHRK
jgi:hypothetical protein